MCPKYHKMMEILGKRWTGQILRGLMAGPRRFNELGSYVAGISDRLLSARLQSLEESEIVARTVGEQRPVTVTYALTDKGAALRPVIEAYQEWAGHWIFPDENRGAHPA